MDNELDQAGFTSVIAGALIGAGLEFKPPLDVLPGIGVELGELVSQTAVPMWAEWRQLLRLYDHEQPRADVEAEVDRLRALPAVWRLDQVYRLTRSREFIEYLAAMMVQTAWGLHYLRQAVTSDGEAAAKLTGLLIPANARTLPHDLKIAQIAHQKDPNDTKELQNIGYMAAVERATELRNEDGQKLVEDIIARGLKLSYPVIDGQSTKLSDRWDERRLLTELADRVARLALPLSSKAGYPGLAAYRAIQDTFRRRAAEQRNATAMFEAGFFTPDGTALELRPLEDQLADQEMARVLFERALQAAERLPRLGAQFRRFVEVLVATKNAKQAAAVTGIAVSTQHNYVNLLLTLLGVE
jgi:hypothetical protein